MSLLSLPSDILILITSHLSLADLLLLTQVSRKLHTLVSFHPFTTPVLYLIPLILFHRYTTLAGRLFSALSTDHRTAW